MARPRAPLEFRRGIARRIRGVRQAMGLDAAGDIAQLIGEKPDTYSRWENPTNPKEFSIYQLKRLCDATGADAWYLMTGELASSNSLDPQSVAAALEAVCRIVSEHSPDASPEQRADWFIRIYDALRRYPKMTYTKLLESLDLA